MSHFVDKLKEKHAKQLEHQMKIESQLQFGILNLDKQATEAYVTPDCLQSQMLNYSAYDRHMQRDLTKDLNQGERPVSKLQSRNQHRSQDITKLLSKLSDKCQTNSLRNERREQAGRTAKVNKTITSHLWQPEDLVE